MLGALTLTASHHSIVAQEWAIRINIAIFILFHEDPVSMKGPKFLLQRYCMSFVLKQKNFILLQ
jgi:hypothetical protein